MSKDDTLAGWCVTAKLWGINHGRTGALARAADPMINSEFQRSACSRPHIPEPTPLGFIQWSRAVLRMSFCSWGRKGSIRDTYEKSIELTNHFEMFSFSVPVLPRECESLEVLLKARPLETPVTIIGAECVLPNGTENNASAFV